MTRLRWTVDAVADLQNIRRYIAIDNPAAAARVISTIRDSARRLRQSPELGPQLVELNVRKLSVVRYPYVILYRIDARLVNVLRVRHMSEDWRPR